MQQEEEKNIDKSQEEVHQEVSNSQEESQEYKEKENTSDKENKDQESSQEVVEESQDSMMEQIQAENQRLEDRNLRLQAEISNMQRRNTIDRNNAAKYRSQTLASELLDVLDNLERALSTEVKSEDGIALKQGIEMVHKQFLAAFEKEKITVLNPENEPFDPNMHQAVSMMPGGEGVDSNIVINVLQKGYKLDDRVIRPAMVIVSE